MATVAAIDNLFPAGAKSTDKQPSPEPEHKGVWASLTKGKSVVIEEVRREALRRDPHRQQYSCRPD